MIIPWGAMFLAELRRGPFVCRGVPRPLQSGFLYSSGPRAFRWRWRAVSGWAVLSGSVAPRKRRSLKTGGIFRFSRNPIYLGLNTTFLASALYTLNPVVLLTGVGLAVVHHRIILAEEECLRGMFGKEYEDYCGRIGRYL